MCICVLMTKKEGRSLERCGMMCICEAERGRYTRECAHAYILGVCFVVVACVSAVRE